MPCKPRACNKSKKNVKSNERVEHGVPLWSRVWFTFQVNGTEERFTGIVSQVRATHWRLVHFHDKSLHMVHLSPSTKGRSWDICDVVMKGRSSLHGKGLFAMSPIKGGQIVTSARFNSATPKEIEAMKSKITASGAIVPPLSTIHHRRSEVLYDPKLFRAARPEEHPNWYAMNDEAPKKANCRLACKKLAPQCLMLFWIAIRVSAPTTLYFMYFYDSCVLLVPAHRSRRGMHMVIRPSHPEPFRQQPQTKNAVPHGQQGPRHDRPVRQHQGSESTALQAKTEMKART